MELVAGPQIHLSLESQTQDMYPMEELGVSCRCQSVHEDLYMDQPAVKPGFGSLPRVCADDGGVNILKTSAGQRCCLHT